ncbi:MAG: hypothetical protein QOC96_2445 [Acidobacteriota bacterium]|nr:hypothetical protein [Acidobacteriota bacterium]
MVIQFLCLTFELVLDKHSTLKFRAEYWSRRLHPNQENAMKEK